MKAYSLQEDRTRPQPALTRHSGLPPGDGDAKVGVTRARKRSRSVLAGGNGASSAPFYTQGRLHG